MTFDMNEGMVAAIPKASGHTAGGNMEVASESKILGELDEDIEVIKRKNLAVKADNINEVFIFDSPFQVCHVIPTRVEVSV